MVSWKEILADAMPPELAREIDIFETQLELRRQGKLEEKIFQETRLRRGVYGQRYDNGQRHDGSATRQLAYPSGDIRKGPETLWDAPGMQRIKIPFGSVTPEQMDVLADLAEEYSDGICHVTTRQDFQLHFIHIDDTPTIMRRLAAVGITTREACGNSVRNVTACPISGVCQDESFDVTPYAKACARFMLGHPDAQDFGRKFKITFSGCASHACGLVTMHDLGFVAKKRSVDGVEQYGFEVYVGGGLGAVPHRAKLFDEFVSREEILPLTQAMVRVFARLGEKKNRARARLKFLVAKLGLEEFRRLVLAERGQLPEDTHWTDYLGELTACQEKPVSERVVSGPQSPPAGFSQWARTNVQPQKQSGFAVATVTIPMGDITAWQMRRLADLARRYVGGSVRTTVEQNIILRWVRETDLPALYRDLLVIGLGEPGAGTIVDVTACPGTDTCKLGIASSRGLGAELRSRLTAKTREIDDAVRGLRIKVSGCFNSCAQHHVADLGFYGVSRKVAGTTVPHFQVVLGGKWEENGGSYGLAIGAIPSKAIPEVVTRITDHYVQDREAEESFQDYVQRVGKKTLRVMIEDLAHVPAYEVDRSYYSDWGDPREFTMADLGTGECAGAVVSLAEFDLAAAEREVFEAQLFLDENDYRKADETAFHAMIEAARGLVKTEYRDVPDDPARVVEEFRKRFHDTGLFHDKYAGPKFANYLFRRHADADRSYSQEAAHHLVEEAQLFIEAAHTCYGRILEQGATATGEPQVGVVELQAGKDRLLGGTADAGKR